MSGKLDVVVFMPVVLFLCIKVQFAVASEKTLSYERGRLTQAGIDGDDAFRELSSMSLSEVMGNDGLSPLGLQRRGERQEQQRQQLEKERLDSIAPMIREIAGNPSISPEARSRTITRLTIDVLAGVDPENLAREEILNQEIEYIQSLNDQLTQSYVVAAQQDSRNLEEALAQAAEELKRATDPTIPYLETGVEFVTSEIFGFLRSSGYSINEMIEEGMGINANELNPSASSAMKRAFDKAQTMSPAERIVAIKKMKEYALRHSGILLDNGWEADSLSAAIQSIFGSTFQNRSAADQNFWMQWFGVGIAAILFLPVVRRIYRQRLTARK